MAMDFNLSKDDSQMANKLLKHNNAADIRDT